MPDSRSFASRTTRGVPGGWVARPGRPMASRSRSRGEAVTRRGGVAPTDGAVATDQLVHGRKVLAAADARCQAARPSNVASPPTRGGQAMNVHFNDTRPANASAETLFEVITDYANYPSFNSPLIHVNVVRKDESGAEFIADRKTKIGKKVRAFDRYKAQRGPRRRKDVRRERVGPLDMDDPPTRRQPPHAQHRCIAEHGSRARHRDEAGPEAPLLRD
jgi:Polyketide cyclase / dehydrase and lipid transport